MTGRVCSIVQCPPSATSSRTGHGQPARGAVGAARFLHAARPLRPPPTTVLLLLVARACLPPWTVAHVRRTCRRGSSVKVAMQAASHEPRDRNGVRCAQAGLSSRRTSTDKSERTVSFDLPPPPCRPAHAWRPDKPSARPPPARARDVWAAYPALLVHRAVKLAGASLFTRLELRGRSLPRRLFLLCCVVIATGAGVPTYKVRKATALLARTAHARAPACARQLLRLHKEARCALLADVAPAGRPPQGWARARGWRPRRTSTRSTSPESSRRTRKLSRSAAAATHWLRGTHALVCCGCSADTGGRGAGGKREMTIRCSLSLKALRCALRAHSSAPPAPLSRTRQAAASIGCWDVHGDLRTPPAGLWSLRAQVSRARCAAGAAQGCLPTTAEILAVELPPPRPMRPAWAPPSVSVSNVTEELDLDNEPDASAAEASAAPGAARRSAAAALERAAAACKVRPRAAHRRSWSRARAAGPCPRHLLQPDRRAANRGSSHMCLPVA